MSFKPDNTPQLSIYLTVANADKAIDFYQKAFGFTLRDKVDDGCGNIHVEMTRGDALIMFCPEGAYGGSKKTPYHLGISMPLNTYIYVEDTDGLYKNAINYGAVSLMEPHDSFWGDRACLLKDHDGYEWMFGTKL